MVRRDFEVTRPSFFWTKRHAMNLDRRRRAHWLCFSKAGTEYSPPLIPFIHWRKDGMIHWPNGAILARILDIHIIRIRISNDDVKNWLNRPFQSTARFQSTITARNNEQRETYHAWLKRRVVITWKKVIESKELSWQECCVAEKWEFADGSITIVQIFSRALCALQNSKNQCVTRA